jgi:hypothetical protein
VSRIHEHAASSHVARFPDGGLRARVGQISSILLCCNNWQRGFLPGYRRWRTQGLRPSVLAKELGVYEAVNVGAGAPSQASLHTVIKGLPLSNPGNIHIKTSLNWDLATAIRYEPRDPL